MRSKRGMWAVLLVAFLAACDAGSPPSERPAWTSRGRGYEAPSPTTDAGGLYGSSPSTAATSPEDAPAGMDLPASMNGPRPSAVSTPPQDPASAPNEADDRRDFTRPATPPRPEASPQEGDLRIVERLVANGYVTGGLQVFLNGEFGAVCSTFFDPVDADVACRQMGFIGGTAIPTAIDRVESFASRVEQFQELVAPMVLENLDCSGTEARLVDCPGAMPDFETTLYSDYIFRDIELAFTYYGQFDLFCDPLRGTYAFVACGTTSGPADGDLRLAGGAEAQFEGGAAAYGWLEIFSGGGWGRVCDKPFRPDRSEFADNPDARFPLTAVTVACRQLGFAAGAKTALGQDLTSLEVRRVPNALRGAARCTGNESSLLQCPGVDLVTADQQCGLRDSVALYCFDELGSIQPAQGSLRLVDGKAGTNYEYGRLEIFMHGFWSSVCDVQGFTPDSAQVACKILGYDGGSAISFIHPYPGRTRSEGQGLPLQKNQVLLSDLPVGLASVDCDGTESSLLECISSIDDLRLCKVPNTNFTDSTLLSCADAASNCTSSAAPEEGALRLRGGFGSPCDPVYTGFVEVYHLSEWGAVCVQQTRPIRETLTADVICRELGFPHGNTIDPYEILPDPPLGVYEYRYNPYYFYNEEEEADERQDRFWLSGVNCRGGEESLLECDIGQGFRQNNAGCTSSDLRLTVACRTFPIVEALERLTTPGADEGDLRLVEQAALGNWQTGRLEVFFDGSWSQVCANGFSAAAADVACRQLGMTSGTVASNLVEVQQHPPTLVYPEVALASVSCDGTEAQLIDCGLGGITEFGIAGCYDEAGPGLILACVASVADDDNVTEGTVRLTDGGKGNGDGSNAGILEVYHAGAWGTVCAAPQGPQFGFFRAVILLNDATASTICRELGFLRGVSRIVTAIPPDVMLLPPWLNRAECANSDDAFADCGPFNYGDTSSCGPTQRLICQDAAESTSVQDQARLIGGSAHPEGAWAYGRIQISDGFNFLKVEVGSGFGRNGVQVACRSLGYATGAQMLSGRLSALPGDDGALDTADKFACTGAEEALADCESRMNRNDNIDYDFALTPSRGARAAAVICTNTSECISEEVEPGQGDVRLVPFSGMLATKPCDDVHFGGVELFNDGQWGRICGEILNDVDIAAYTIDARVVCRQLGFPFGGIMAAVRAGSFDGYDDYADETASTVWATDVHCTGTEGRLDECFFPQNFEGLRRFVPSFLVPSVQPLPGVGIQGPSCETGAFLGVVCRRFNIKESSVLQ